MVSIEEVTYGKTSYTRSKARSRSIMTVVRSMLLGKSTPLEVIPFRGDVTLLEETGLFGEAPSVRVFEP